MADSITYLLLGVSIALNAVCIWLMTRKDKVEHNGGKVETVPYIVGERGSEFIIATKRYDL